MKNIYNLFLCLLVCTALSALNFPSASAMMRSTQFQMDEDTPAVEMQPPIAYGLQTIEAMEQKQKDFSARYEIINASTDTKIDLLLNLKSDIWNYLKILGKQRKDRPETISDNQILRFFTNLAYFIHHKPMPPILSGNYRLHYDSMQGIYGAIICIIDNPPYSLVITL